MSILKELMTLREAPEVPVELKDVIAAFPKHHAKALEKLWGGRRLIWHGERFFDHDALGPAYQKALDAAEEYINDGYEADVNQEIDASGLIEKAAARVKALQGDDDEDDNGGEDDHDEDDSGGPGGYADFTWKAGFGERDGGSNQECYLGYDPKKDKLYIGFDAWISEENFNTDFDKAFEEATGLEHDLDDEDHAAVFNEAWQEFQRDGLGFWGLVFEVDSDYNVEEAWPPAPRGFYRGTYKEFKANHPNVIDLRLD